MIGGYAAGDSLLHRASARSKLLALLALVTLLGFLPRWWLLLPAVTALVLAYPLSRLRLAPLWRSLRAFLLFGALLAAVQVWWSGPLRAVEIVGQLLVAVLAGNLVMMTTRVSDMVRAIARVLLPGQRRAPRRARLELLLSLTIGCIPRVAQAMTTAREAAQARGVRPRLLVVMPSAVVTIVRQADELGDALAARGL